MTNIRHRAGALTLAGLAAVAGLGAAHAQMATFVEDDFSMNQVGPTAAGGTITPKFSRNKTVWTVDQGPVATDGTSVGNYRPVADSLNFGAPEAGAGNPAVTLPLGDVDDGPASIAFTLRQSNGGRGSYLFDLTVRDTAGKAYTIHMSPNPGYFATSGFAILDDPPYVAGLAGAALTTDSQTLRLEFDPATGFALWSSAYPDGPVLRFANVHYSKALQSVTFKSRDGGGTWVSWFLDDVTVRADERTADERARAEAAAAARASGAARHEAFRREHHARMPHPQWFNSLRPGADGGPALLLADDYQARYSILLPAEPSAQETQAATELAFWLKMLSGTEFGVRKDGGQPLTGPVVSLGRTKLAEDANLAPVDLKDDGYRIAVVNGNVLLSGGRRTGTLNAVYALLEEDLGCRWYLPGNDGTVIPTTVKLALQPAPRVFVSPFDKLRWVGYNDVGDGDWQRRNRTRPGEWASGFAHTYAALVSGKLFAEHPDYFALLAGKRSTQQICPSHPEVREIVLQNVRKYLAARPNADFVDISPNDGGGACHCPLCQAIIDREGGAEMGPLLALVNHVADGIAKDYPNVRVTTLAYLNTVVPPKTFGPSPNVVPWLATDAHAWGFGDLFVWETERSARAMQEWHDRCQASTIVWDYPSHFGFSPYNLNLPVIADNLKWYAARGAVGIFFQTQHNLNLGFPQSYQRSWLFAKLGWDPARSTRDLVRDFNYGFYGNAAPRMQAFDELLWRTWEDWYGTTLGEWPKALGGTPRPWTPEQIREAKLSGRVELDEAFWRKAEEVLLAAEAAAGDDTLLTALLLTPLAALHAADTAGAAAGGATISEERFAPGAALGERWSAPEGVAETGDGALRLRARERADAIARLRLPARLEGEAVSICFTLKPPPGSQRLDLSIGDPETNQRYAVMLTTKAGYFANRGGFYDGATVGIPGEALRSEVPNLVRLAVDPRAGMAVLEVNGREVLRQTALTARYSAKAIGDVALQVFGDVVWEVSNLVVRTGSLEATPEERARAARADIEARISDLKQRVGVARLPLMVRQLEQGPRDPKVTADYLARVDEFEAIAKRAGILYIEGMVGPAVPGGTLQPKLDYWRKLAAPPSDIPYIELDNTWRFMPDPEKKGIGERWFATEYSDLAWGSVKTGSWTTQGFAGGQPAWYRQTFTVTGEMLAREALWMLFGGVDETAEVYINGKLAFEHTVEATGLPVETLWNKAFVFDARPFVQAGANTLAVRVTDTVGAAGIWIPVRFVPGKEKPDAQALTDRIEELLKIRGVLRREGK